MNPVARRAAIRLADRLGYHLYPKWQEKDFHLARHIARLIDKYAIDCVVDVGANRGQFGSFMRRSVGHCGSLVSIEPVAAAYQELAHRAAGDAKWLAIQCALGAEAGRGQIHIARNDDMSSFLPLGSSAPPGFQVPASAVESEEVEMRTLDAVWAALAPRHKFTRIYLKLDTQGFDLEVIKGGETALASVQALQIEMSVLPLYEGMPDYISALGELTRRGFVLSAVSPVHSDSRMRIIEFDCVMVRDA